MAREQCIEFHNDLTKKVRTSLLGVLKTPMISVPGTFHVISLPTLIIRGDTDIIFLASGVLELGRQFPHGLFELSCQ